MITARDVMRTDIITVHPDCTLTEAATLLLEHGISGLPVVDEFDQLVGVISEFALLAVAYDQPSRREPVREHMTRSVITVSPDTPLIEVADIFILHRIRRIPVVQQGKLVGLLSRRELLRAGLAASAPICRFAPLDSAQPNATLGDGLASQC